jgi:hypothetical protein
LPSDFVNSISPSKVPAVVQVPEGNKSAQTPLVGSDNVAVIVESTVVLPTSRILSLTVPLDKSIGAQVVLSSTSNVLPAAAVLLSFKVKVNSGRVSPTTNFIVDEYAIITSLYTKTYIYLQI